MSNKIYTKTGDEGETGLFGGARLSKDHIRIESYGTVDELNAFIGLLKDELQSFNIPSELASVQNRLFTIGSNLASDPDKEMITPDLQVKDIELLESAIDTMESQLPKLKNFVIPGGHRLVSSAHVARTVCRRAERRIITLSQSSTVEPLIIQYLNRLSDYLFVLSRYVAHQLQIEEQYWKGRDGA